MSPLRAAFLSADAAEKCARTAALRLDEVGAEPDWPVRPGRPARPHLVGAREVPRRAVASQAGRVGLLHALAHIELNAVDLALDIIGRFAASSELGEEAGAFVASWLSVAQDEARHFGMLAGRLAELGSSYGALDAHDGLWQTAEASRHDLLARLAIAPLVHEARGLDVSPPMIAKLRAAGDDASAAILDVIYRDEIGHVAAGWRWFRHVVDARGKAPETAFAEALGALGLAEPHPPFNLEARRRAGLPPGLDSDYCNRKLITAG